MKNIMGLRAAFSAFFALVAAVAFCTVAAPSARADYDHTSYNQSGLIVQYDGPDNGANASTLVNLGSAGSAFNLALVASGTGSISEGVITVGGANSWSMSSPVAEAQPTNGGYTVEFVGEQTGGSQQADNCVAISLDAGESTSAVATPIRFSLGTVRTHRFSIQALVNAWGSWQNSFSGTGTVAGIVKATRTAVVDSSTRVISYYENGILVGSSSPDVAGTTDNGLTRVCLGDLRRRRGYATWAGKMYSVRIYNRPLSAAEIVANYDIDGYRFYGHASEAGQLLIANNPADIDASTPASGVHSPESGATLNCSAAEPFYQDGVRYVATGYTIETSPDIGRTWGTPVAHSGTSYEYVNTGVTTRLTWQWAPSHYRLYVAKNGGSETFSFSPAIDIADEVDTTTAGGYYQPGTVVSVTAQPMSTPFVSTLTKWTGDAGETTANPVAVTMDGVRNIRAWFSRPWVLDETANQVCKDEWILQCDWYPWIDKFNGSRKITGVVSGSGVLDMSELNRDLADQGVEQLVKALGNDAFLGNKNITGLVFPAREYGNGIGIIGQSTFKDCSNLAGGIDLWSVESIGANAFSGCEKLSGDLVLPVCWSVGDRAFRMATPGKAFVDGRLVAPELTTMEAGAFASCAFTSAYLPKLTAGSGNYPFYNDTYLTNIVLSADVATLPSEFIYADTPASGVLVLDFPKNRPTTAFSTWMTSTKKSQIVIRTPEMYSSNWTSDTANFVPLTDVTDAPSAEVRAVRRIIGQYAGCWLSEISRSGGFTIIVR